MCDYASCTAYCICMLADHASTTQATTGTCTSEPQDFIHQPSPFPIPVSESASQTQSGGSHIVAQASLSYTDYDASVPASDNSGDDSTQRSHGPGELHDSQISHPYTTNSTLIPNLSIVAQDDSAEAFYNIVSSNNVHEEVDTENSSGPGHVLFDQDMPETVIACAYSYNEDPYDDKREYRPATPYVDEQP